MTVVFIGRFGQDLSDALRRSAAKTNAPPQLYDDGAQARDALGDARNGAPRCIFIDARSPDIGAFVGWLRGEARLFSVPLVFMVEQLDEQGYAKAHALGADDAIDVADFDGIRRRLVNLAEFDPEQRPPISEGIAIVAHPEMGRRRILGRTLRQVGFDVAFAADAGELEGHAAGREAPRLAIVASHLPPTGALDAIRDFRRSGSGVSLPVIVLATAADGASLLHETQKLMPAMTTSEAAPPHDLVFLANELLRPDFRELRGAPRVLYATLCGFRLAGDLKSDHGVTYNVSREGLYVRTLVPPPTGSYLWLELRPPGASAAVHLRGRVVWARRYGASGGAPPGFGLRFTPEACPPWDVQAFWDSYDRHSSSPPFPL